MEPDNNLNLPFLTRDMLRYKEKTVYELQIIRGANAVGTLYITGITRSGTFTFKATTTSNGQPSLTKYRLDDFPIFVSVVDKDYGFAKRGAYVQLQLLMNGDIGQELLRGYVGGYESLTYPSTTNHGHLGPETGNPTTIESSDPAAGAEIDMTRNDYFLKRFLSFTATLVADATVANRYVHLKITDGLNGSSHEVASTIAQTASQTRKYHFMAGLNVPCYSEDDDIFVTVPDRLWMGGSGRIQTVTTGLVAGDNWGVAEVGVEEFIG
jgi:hypothetical protein